MNEHPADDEQRQPAAEPEPKVTRLPARTAKGALVWKPFSGLGGLKSSGSTTRAAQTRVRLPGGGK